MLRSLAIFFDPVLGMSACMWMYVILIRITQIYDFIYYEPSVSIAIRVCWWTWLWCVSFDDTGPGHKPLDPSALYGWSHTPCLKASHTLRPIGQVCILACSKICGTKPFWHHYPFSWPASPNYHIPPGTFGCQAFFIHHTTICVWSWNLEKWIAEIASSFASGRFFKL